MKIYLIALGSELLSGMTVNSNAAFISRELYTAGFKAEGHLTLPDDPTQLVEALATATVNFDIVIVTGGLGPTCDDKTRAAVATFLGTEMRFRPELALKLEERYGTRLQTIRDQATVPEGVDLLYNSLGTASGLTFKKGRATFFCLPGVPGEMKALFIEQVLPLILKQGRAEVATRSYHCSGLIEADIDPLLREIESLYPAIEMGIYPLRGIVAVRMAAPQTLGAQLDHAMELLDDRFSARCFSRSGQSIEEALHALLIEKRVTLALAESCSGGAIAARLTSLAGASNYFLGSFVTYSNAMKSAILKVPEQLILDCGAVSEEVVRSMWEGALLQAGSDCAIAVTGIAGPEGGSAEKPVGTVWVALGIRGSDPQIFCFQARGNRAMIIEYTVNRVLGELYLLLAKPAQN